MTKKFKCKIIWRVNIELTFLTVSLTNVYASKTKTCQKHVISTIIISCYKILRYSYQVHIVGKILVNMQMQ